MSHSQVLVLFTALLFIIFAGIAGSLLTKSVEPFASSATTEYIVNSEKALLYFANGIYNFFSSGERWKQSAGLTANITDKTSEYATAVLQLVGLFPNYIDSYCFAKSPAEKQTDTKCSLYHIDNYSCPDSQVTNATSCSSINTIVGARGDNCMVRILDNNYQFLKRCVKFDTIKIEVVSVSGGAPQKSYTLTVTGDITEMVLLRPMFISFGNYGVYRVSYEDLLSEAVDNVMVSFTNSDVNSVKAVDYNKDGYQDYKQNSDGSLMDDYKLDSDGKEKSTALPPPSKAYKIRLTEVKNNMITYPAVGATVGGDVNYSMYVRSGDIATRSLETITTGGVLSKFPITIYYLGFKNFINISPQNTVYSMRNVFNLLLSKTDIETIVMNGTTTVNSSAVGVTFNRDTCAANSSSINKLGLAFDINSSKPAEIFNITVDTNSNQNMPVDPESFKLFKHCVSQLRARKQTHQYHVNITMMMDAIILVAFLKDSTGKDRIFYDKYTIQNGTTTPILCYNIGNTVTAATTATAAIPDGNLLKIVQSIAGRTNKDLYNLTSIPNYYSLARSLGYLNYQ